MKEWKLSCYTSVIRCDSGEILLHNSFMGAIARIPAYKSEIIEIVLQEGIKESDMCNQYLKELCEGGFFVPSDFDERKLIGEVLDKERESFRFNMIILPHENCNFRCKYCYEKFERGKMKSDIINGLKSFVNSKIKDSKELKELTISWFGGEPLLARDVIHELSDSFIDTCKQKGVNYSSSMTTNGYLLTPDVVTSLLERKIKGFQVTLDGPEVAHNKNRRLISGEGTYRKILDNILKMQDMDEEFFVRIRVNFNKSSIPSIEQWIIDEILPLFANDHRFAMSFHPVEKWGGPNDSTLDICDVEFASPTRLKFIEKSRVLDFSDQIIKEFLVPHGNVCYASKESSIVIGSDGTVYKCTVAFDDPRNIVGKVTSDGKLVINQKLWNLWTKIDDKDTTWCDSCSFYPSCQGRKCPLTTINQNKPRCPITRKEYETLVKSVAFGKDFSQNQCQ